MRSVLVGVVAMAEVREAVVDSAADECLILVREFTGIDGVVLDVSPVLDSFVGDTLLPHAVLHGCTRPWVSRWQWWWFRRRQ